MQYIYNKVRAKRWMTACSVFIGAALLSTVITSCKDSKWDDPMLPTQVVYGNPDLIPTNVVTIKDLKTRYSTQINTEGQYAEIKEFMQIKGYVTCNDMQDNMSNEISIQDETGAIFIGIAQGGIYGYLPLGTEILVELNGLYIGNYRKSATIGTPYTNKDGDVSVSRMSRFLWHEHFTYTGRKKIIEPELFADGNTSTTWDISTDAGKLGTLKNVTIKNGGYYNSITGNYVSNVKFTDESTYAMPDFSTSWYFNEQPDGQNGGVQIYNSNYANFAANKLPHGRMNITGVFKRYRDQWEIIIRSLKDVEVLE